MKKLILKKGREKAILRRHPWIFSGAVKSIEGPPESGETVAVYDSRGHFLARAAYSPDSQIRARIWTWDEDTVIDRAFFQQRIRNAAAQRQSWIDRDNTTAWRLVHAESDGLPGLIVDRYEEVLVMQVLSAGMAHWRETIADCLADLLAPSAIYERSDVTVRELEGLPESTGLVRGSLPDQPLTILENGLRFRVDVVTGQKTGFYLDQRDNRAFCRSLAAGKDVLNCFAYTGGFSVASLAGGARTVLSIDSSEEALDLARENGTLNALPEEDHATLAGDVFESLRLLRDQGRQFDLVILDPPKFAPTASQARQAARGYKDINLYGFKLLRPGGVLMTFSCSGGIDAAFFQKIVADAALDAAVDARICHRMDQAPDHPTLLAFPEGSYLKGLVCQV